MKKMKRPLAALGALLLFAMYGMTLFFAVTDHPGTTDLLMASIACTAILSVLLYAYSLVYRIIREKHSALEQPEETDNRESCQDSGHHT